MRVRQAIAYGIDRDAIVQATSYGTAATNQLAIPKGNSWYTPLRQVPLRHRARPSACSTRRARSRRTIDMLVTSEYPETVTAAQVIADNLAPLGITVNIRTVDFATWLDEQNSGTLRHADDGLARQHRSRRLLLRAAPHRRQQQRAEVSPTPRSTDCSTPAASKPNQDARARRSTRKAATIIADEVQLHLPVQPVGHPGVDDQTCPATTPAATRPSASAPRASARAATPMTGRRIRLTRSCVSWHAGCCIRSSC